MKHSRIVLVSSRLGGGGAERIVATLADHWAACGHDVTVVLLRRDSSAEYPVSPDVRIERLALIGESNPTWHPANLGRLASLRRGLVRLAPDVVVSFLEKLNVAVLLALNGTGIPVVATEHLAPWMNPIGFPWETLRRLTYRRAQRVISPTRAITDWLSERIAGRFDTIPYPFAAYPPMAGDVRRQVVFAAGRLDPQKGFDLLIDAFAVLAPNRTEWSLEIAGEGPLRAALQRQIAARGLTARVRLLGHVRDIGECYRSAEIFVLSSRHEAYPMALCEALSAGCAVVATDCPTGPREILGNPPAGRLVLPDRAEALAEAMNELMGSAALVDELRQLALQRFVSLTTQGGLSAWDRALAAWTTGAT